MKVVAGILIYKEKVLALKRPFSQNKYISLKYEFPGGKVKKKESFSYGLKRELREDLNINVIDPIPYFNTTYKYPDFKVCLSFFVCYLNELKIKLNVHIDYKLLAVKELRKVNWLDADYAVIEYIEKKGLPTN